MNYQCVVHDVRFQPCVLFVFSSEIKDHPQIRCQKYLSEMVFWYILQRIISEQEEDDDGREKLPFCAKAC